MGIGFDRAFGFKVWGQRLIGCTCIPKPYKIVGYDPLIRGYIKAILREPFQWDPMQNSTELVAL